MAWLAAMAKKGWHLCRVGMGRYWFTAGEPGDYVYRTDYVNTWRVDPNGMLSRYAAAGWTYAGKLLGWYYFRAPAHSPATAFIPDEGSRISRIRQLMGIAIMMFFVNGAGLAVRIKYIREYIAHRDILSLTLYSVMLLLVILLGYGSVRLTLRVRDMSRGTK